MKFAIVLLVCYLANQINAQTSVGVCADDIVINNFDVTKVNFKFKKKKFYNFISINQKVCWSMVRDRKIECCIRDRIEMRHSHIRPFKRHNCQR